MLALALALTAFLRPVAIEGAAHCPSAGALARALSSMLPEAQVVRGEAGDALVVRVDDLGARWRLTIGESRRELADGARRCEERARQAAVVVALALEPPSVESPTVLATPPTAEAAASAPPPAEDEIRAPIEEKPRTSGTSVARRMLSIELGARLDVAPAADGGALAQGGVAARLALGRGRFAGALGIAAITPSTMDLLPSPVRVTRIPIDLSARFVAWVGRGADTAFDAGAVASILLLEGVAGQGGDRVDLGVRAAATERIWLREDMAFFASAEASFLPRTYALVIDQSGMSRAEGRTPDLWLGLSLGWIWRWQ